VKSGKEEKKDMVMVFLGDCGQGGREVFLVHFSLHARGGRRRRLSGVVYVTRPKAEVYLLS
jgi:hypothetical protein